MKRVGLIAVLMFALALPVFPQTVRNFDKEVSLNDSSVVIQPPPGKVWTLLRGSFQILPATTPIEHMARARLGVTIYEQVGTEPSLCTNILRLSLADTSWVPIIGGYVAHPRWGNLAGQDAPIVLPYPNRLVIQLNNLDLRLQSWTRFTISESELH